MKDESEAMIHPDPRVHIPHLQKLIEEAWELKTIRKETNPDSVSFRFTIPHDRVADDVFSTAIAAMV